MLVAVVVGVDVSVVVGVLVSVYVPVDVGDDVAVDVTVNVAEVVAELVRVVVTLVVGVVTWQLTNVPCANADSTSLIAFAPTAHRVLSSKNCPNVHAMSSARPTGPVISSTRSFNTAAAIGHAKGFDT